MRYSSACAPCGDLLLHSCPFPAFVCACVYSAAKVLAALGYTSAAEGRIPGTMISLLANTVLESIVLLAGFKSIISRR